MKQELCGARGSSHAQTVHFVTETYPMIDLIYIVAPVLFFGLMILYVAGCNRLGHSTDGAGAGEDVQ